MININGLKLNSVDYILIVDREFSIIYNTRYDNRLNVSTDKLDKSEYINKNFFEIYPSIEKETSSIVRCMTSGEIIVKKYQKFEDFKGRIYCTHNITIPIIIKGKINGVIEFVKDVTTIDNIENEKGSWTSGELENSGVNFRNITFDNIITNSRSMRSVIEQAKIFTNTHNPTLVYGETGTGKEMLVQAMISYSGIPRRKVIIQNCAAVPENLIEAILFGTSKGAYTGSENRKGLFEVGDGGIIFLDEINSMPYSVQGKLLRVLQDGSFRPVGSNEEKFVNVKVIAAMNIDPMIAIEKNELRRDLFYRLSSSMIKIPSLRERKEDIQYFVDYYIQEFNKIYLKDVKRISTKLEKIFMDYEWEGNVRELKHIIESMICITDDEILDIHHLPAYMYDRIYQENSCTPPKKLIKDEAIREDTENLNEEEYNLNKILKAKEREVIEKALRITKGNKTKAGELLGIPRQTLKYKMDKLGIDSKI